MKARILFFILFIAIMDASGAQEVEYKMEIGGGVGLTAYEGDFNGNIMKDLQPMGSLILRHNLNPHMALKFDLSVGKLKGNSDNVTTYYSEQNAQHVSFSNTLYDLTCRYEYNFWGYGKGAEFKGYHRFTPYILLGLGFTYVNGNSSTFTVNMPIGGGVKYKLKERLNIGAEWAMHFSMSDKLDGVKDPYGIKSSGIFKNTDCYSVLQLFLTYDIMPKCINCNNNDD
jgi:hypothetical protein